MLTVNVSDPLAAAVSAICGAQGRYARRGAHLPPSPPPTLEQSSVRRQRAGAFVAPPWDMHLPQSMRVSAKFEACVLGDKTNTHGVSSPSKKTLEANGAKSRSTTPSQTSQTTPSPTTRSRSLLQDGQHELLLSLCQSEAERDRARLPPRPPALCCLVGAA